jgi:methyl-accepting chemotaxis protein
MRFLQLNYLNSLNCNFNDVDSLVEEIIYHPILVKEPAVLKNKSLKLKLMLSFLTLALVPLTISNLISFSQAKNEITVLTKEKGQIVAAQMSENIEGYFAKETSAIVDISAMPSTAEALKGFSGPFANYNEEFKKPEYGSDEYQEVKGFYNDQFGKMYAEKNSGKSPAIADILGKLDRMAIVAQADFIARNPNPLGSKHKMDRPNRSNRYSEVHEKFHPKFRSFLESHGLYDVFLVNNEGRVVYTVFKETDFATSLKFGPWGDSGLASAFNGAAKLKEGEYHIDEFKPYLPSYEAPASFASTPVFDDGKRLGVLIIQLPLDKITQIAADREGLGELGETLLVGPDYKLRADTFRNKATHNVASSFAEGSKHEYNHEPVKRALAGESGDVSLVTYDGTEVYSVFKPIKIANHNWAVVVEFAKSEVYAPLDRLQYAMIAIIAFAALITGLVTFFFSNWVSNTLNQIAKRLSASNHEVSQASSMSASSSTELSEAATEQAASLQETMASIEEISAMVTQNAESAGRVTQAVDQNQVATQDGNQSVNEMLQSIVEIKTTTDEILGQMESSNKEFGEIVKIIKTIDEKTKVINDIVFQTKLLSFNASVEAARAGEHGKGFAVVAEEVGNLAQMSGNAAKDITTMLSSSIQKVNEIVDKTSSKIDQLVETGKDKIATGQSKAMACKSALQKISENAQAVKTMVAEITHASKEQSQGVQEISKAIAQLDQVTQQNSAVAQSSSTQAEQLHAQSIVLSNAVTELVKFVSGDDANEVSEVHSVAHNKVVSISSKAKTDSAKVKTTSTFKKASGDGHGTPPKYENF